jgi:hypothetical protein
MILINIVLVVFGKAEKVQKLEFAKLIVKTCSKHHRNRKNGVWS